MSGHSYYATAVNELAEQEMGSGAAVGVKDWVKNQSCDKPFRLKDLEGAILKGGLLQWPFSIS